MDLDRNGVHIRYEVTGAGPPVLLSHGFSASSDMFAANARALGEGNTIITWDLRGHGGSDSPTDPSAYSEELSVADMAALLDAVGAERAVVGGHSLGGYLSLAFHLAHPERVEALVLIDTGPGYRNDEARAGWNEMAEQSAVNLEKKGLAALGGSEEVKASVHRDASGLARAARGILAQHDDRVLASLPTIGVPTLVIVGEDDKLFRKAAAYMTEKIPEATLVVIPGAGHAPNVTHAERFDSELRSFLERTRTAKGTAQP
jgi:pimeloyl-ACP methyl ester carboxylesterase